MLSEEMPSTTGEGAASREAPGSQEESPRSSQEHALQQGRRLHRALCSWMGTRSGDPRVTNNGQEAAKM